MIVLVSTKYQRVESGCMTIKITQRNTDGSVYGCKKINYHDQKKRAVYQKINQRLMKGRA